MKIGLIDVDGHNFPNLPLMKISAWHKRQGDHVEWYERLFSGHMDKVYMSKIFSFTQDYPYFPDADEIIKEGTGYCIKNIKGKEVFDKSRNNNLPSEVEHIYPDYSLYPELTKNTAYGFLTRGCPRNCEFCHVGCKEGQKSYKVADLREFWRGQKEIKLLDPNLLAYKEHLELLQQLIDSRASVDFTQGLDARLLTSKNMELIKRINVTSIHFAWDSYADRKRIIPKLKEFKEITGCDKRKASVYVLTNFDSTHDEDLKRIYELKEIGFNPFIMIYEKEKLPKGHITRRLQRWVNSRRIWETIDNFDDYRG